MNLDIKKNIWGYSEEEVQQYITKLNEEHEKKLSEKEERIQELENEVDKLQIENEEYKKQQMEVSAAIINAQNYAEQLKKETREKEEQERQKVDETISNQKRRLEIHIREVESLRRRVKAILESMDTELHHTQNKAETLAKMDIAEEIYKEDDYKEDDDESCLP